VNNRRSLWVMKHADPQAVARAIESLAGSEQTHEVTRKALASLSYGESPADAATPRAQEGDTNGVSLRGWEESNGSPHLPHSFLPPARPQTAAPNKYSSLAVGFPGPSPMLKHDRRMQGPWNQTQGRNAPMSQAVQPPSGFGRPQPRRGYQVSSGRYRNAVSDFNANPFGSTDMILNSRPGSAFQYGRDHQGITPSTPNRPNKYSRQHSGSTSQWSGGNNNQNSLVSHTPMGPLIHMTETSVKAWNEQVMEFYAVIRNFVEKHASMPDYTSLVQLARTSLWPILLATYHPLSENEASSYLDFHLKEESSKSCLVTRVIIDYVVNRVWVPAAWIGSDRESTYELMRLEDDLERTTGMLVLDIVVSKALN
jgi:hypothetical protein